MSAAVSALHRIDFGDGKVFRILQVAAAFNFKLVVFQTITPGRDMNRMRQALAPEANRIEIVNSHLLLPASKQIFCSFDFVILCWKYKIQWHSQRLSIIFTVYGFLFITTFFLS